MATNQRAAAKPVDGQTVAGAEDREYPKSHDYDPERRLWTAVLLQAVMDWQSHNVRAHREAETFLLKRPVDLEAICHRAGLNPDAFQSKLRRLRRAQPLAGLPGMVLAA
jgi:hypothetical protein